MSCLITLDFIHPFLYENEIQPDFEVLHDLLLMLHGYRIDYDDLFQADIIFEPPNDKTNKMTVRPAKTQISLSIRPV